MAGVDGAAEAVEQMKLQQQEKSKEELVRRPLAASPSRWLHMLGRSISPQPAGRPHSRIRFCSTCSNQIGGQVATPRRPWLPPAGRCCRLLLAAAAAA